MQVVYCSGLVAEYEDLRLGFRACCQFFRPYTSNALFDIGAFVAAACAVVFGFEGGWETVEVFGGETEGIGVTFFEVSGERGGYGGGCEDEVEGIDDLGRG